MKNIIVTGASGMIGSAIVKEALGRGMGVTAVVRKDTPNMDNLPGSGICGGLTVIECGIDGYGSLGNAAAGGQASSGAGCDAFFHMAWRSTGAHARDDVYTHIENIKYTIDAVHAAHRLGCSVFVDAGSQAEYGVASGKLGCGTPCNPESGYGIAKYAAGKMARLAASQLGMRSCHARILSTYGEGMDSGAVIVYLIKTLLGGKKPSLTKCGQMWDYMHAQDTARAFLAIAENGADGKAYPLGTGIARPLREYFEIIRDIIDPGLELGFGEKEYYPHQPMFLCADIDELRRDTGFEPSVSFEEGIRRTIGWARNLCPL